MQRFTSLIIICFLALFFCTIAYTIQQDASFLPEQNKEGSLPSEERSNHLLKERKATLNPALRNESKASELEINPFGREVDEKKKTTIAPELRLEAKTPEPSGRKKSSSAALQYRQTEEDVHFLLIGRWWKNPSAEILMVVSLIPESCARLTAVDPAIEVAFEDRHCPIGELLAQDAGHDCLYRAITEISGLEPQFYIDLNLHGFIEMIDLLQKEGPQAVSSHNIEPEYIKIAGGSGDDLLSFLIDFTAPPDAKEELLIGYLLMASKLQSTGTGLKLLWIGYQNLKTDLSLSDLIQVRNVTGGISPLEVSLTVITP
ncbi:MAG: hypothetical protein ACOX3N_01690 [Dethiobacteria bacterium]